MDVLVLGNGFDLSHNLPTTYLCFLKVTEYLSNNTLKEGLTIGEIFNSVKDECPQIKNSYNEYQSVYDNLVLDFEKIVQLSDKCVDNMWWNYFKHTYNKNVGWIDFENEISVVIEKINCFFEKNSTPNRGFDLKKATNSIASYFQFFVKESNPYEYQSLHEGVMLYNCSYKYNSEYIIKRDHERTAEIDRRKIAIKLFDLLKDFADILNIYFEIFVDNTIEELKKANLIVENDIYKEFEYVVTYNYTKTFEKIYNKSVAHIHGVINQIIVLGINPDHNDEIDGDLTFIDFKKYYQRVVNGTDLDYLKILIEMKELTEKKHQVSLSIVGHSLDITDQDTLKELFDASNDIRIYYHKKEKIPEYVQNLIRFFGKTKFDELRFNKNLHFLPLEKLDGPAEQVQVLHIK